MGITTAALNINMILCLICLLFNQFYFILILRFCCLIIKRILYDLLVQENLVKNVLRKVFLYLICYMNYVLRKIFSYLIMLYN